MADIVFDRVVSSALLTELSDGGRFHGLLERGASRPDIADVQLRREQRGRRSWASLYLGLTSVLDLDERHGQFRLRAHPTHKAAGHFDEAWGQWQDSASLGVRWAEVDDYLGRLLENEGVAARLWRREGTVQTALTSGHSSVFGAVQREAVVSFPSAEAKRVILELSTAIRNSPLAATRIPRVWPRTSPGMATEFPTLGTSESVTQGLDPLAAGGVLEADRFT